MNESDDAKGREYIRQAKAAATLDRLEREDPTRWYHYLQIGFAAIGIVALPFLLFGVVYGLWGILS